MVVYHTSTVLHIITQHNSSSILKVKERDELIISSFEQAEYHCILVGEQCSY